MSGKTRRLKEKCIRGHVVSEVGRDRTECKECRRLRQRKDPFRRQMHPAEIPNLRSVRIGLGLTHRELSKRSGVSHNHIANMEQGVRKSSETTRRKLLAAIVVRQRELQREYHQSGGTIASGKPSQDTTRVGSK